MKSSFDILSKVQRISILMNDITGTFDGYKAYLNVPIKFKFEIPHKGHEFKIDAIQSELVIPTLNSTICNHVKLVDFNITQEKYETSRIFQFELSNEAIKFIESKRDKDLKLTIKLSGNSHMRVWVYNTKFDIKTQEDSHIIRFSSSITFTVAQSDWLKILKELHYETFKLIELPFNHKTLKEAYDNIIKEFILAEEYFNKQDYTKTVAHCRSAMDALTRNLRKIEDNVESETNFKWLDNINEATFNWIDAINKTSSSLTSKSHHAGLKKDFQRHEAEAIYLVLLGLLNFIGHEKNK